MAFKKFEQTGKRTIHGILAINIRMSGHIYIGTAAIDVFPITNEYHTAEFFVDDVDKCRIALLPLKEITGSFNISMSGPVGKQIYCTRFLDAYKIKRNQQCLCKIEEINGKRMFVFQVERDN